MEPLAWPAHHLHLQIKEANMTIHPDWQLTQSTTKSCRNLIQLPYPSEIPTEVPPILQMRPISLYPSFFLYM